MRFGSKVLFEDVSTTFSAGRRYGLTGPNGAGKSTFMKLLTGELPPQRGIGRPAPQGWRAAPGSIRLRSLSRHRHGDHGQPAAVERARGARASVRQGRPHRPGRHAARRARGDRRRRGRVHGGERRRRAAPGSRHRRGDCTRARWPSCRGARRCGCCWPRRCSAIPRRCCSTNRPTTSTSTRFTGCASCWCATTAR